MDYRILKILISFITLVTAGISPVHDFKDKMNAKVTGEKIVMDSPHKVLKHLDDKILKGTKIVTQNHTMEESLYQMSKDLVSAILSKLEIQDKITRMTREALDAPGKNEGVTAIETRRILDYISRTLSGNILTLTKASTEPELHRLVYGLAQIAAEVSIVSALKDITYATSLSKKQSVDLNLRKKRSIDTRPETTSSTHASVTIKSTTVYNVILNKTVGSTSHHNNNAVLSNLNKMSPYSVIPKYTKKSIHVLDTKHEVIPLKRFLNQTALDIENDRSMNDSDAIVVDKSINSTNYARIDSLGIDTQEMNNPELVDDWADSKDNIYRAAPNSDIVGDIEIDRPDAEDKVANEMKIKLKLEKLEVKAKKAILYAGDVAYLTAASVVALRRSLTALIEVQMSVKYAKNGRMSHKELMANLAKTAAQQAAKEAKSATSKSLACERVTKLALKYTAQSRGAILNHVANRIVMDTLSLSTLAKSMAFVASDIAINSLYLSNEVKGSPDL